jgi:anaerobic ribonucleoside-triphosphate reductase activating protein
MHAEVSRLHFPVTTLGPGRRVGLWFQGCSLRCHGCISVDTWERGTGRVPLDALAEAVADLAADADGLTVSGGEPFEQPGALAAVLRRWRSVSDRSVLVFTGLELGATRTWRRENPALVDGLITGRLRSDLPQTLAMRGSDNQRLHVLSELGAEFSPLDRPASPADRRLDVMFDDEGAAWFAGIPARGDLARLRRAMAAAGHTARTSDQVGAAAA